MTDETSIDQIDPEATKQRLIEVRHNLLRLHKALLDSERESYERVHGRVESPYELFGLVTKHPWFAWLRQLSELIVQIDERLDADEPMSGEEAAVLLNQVRSLLKPSESGEGLEKKYYDALQREPEIILMHAQISKLLAARA